MPNSNKSWTIDNALAVRSRFKKIAKDHPVEFDSCMNNLHKVRKQLIDGKKLGGFKFGFFRSEGGGVYRIGQAGVPSAKELRLYVYFYAKENGIIYPLTIGTKETQGDDINTAKQTVRAAIK